MRNRFSSALGFFLIIMLLHSQATAFQSQARPGKRVKASQEQKTEQRSKTGEVAGIQTTAEFVAQYPRARFEGAPFYRHQGPGDESMSFGAIYGTTLGTGGTPVASAWNHINQISPLLGDDWGALIPRTQDNGQILLPLMNRGGAARFYTFRFDQYYEDLPVFRSGVGFLTRNEPGNPLVVSGIDIKNLDGFSVGQTGPARVTKPMLENVGNLMDQGDEPELKSVLGNRKPPIRVSEEKLVIFAGTSREPAEPELAVQFIAERGSIQTLPDYHKYLVLASPASGKILLAETQIHEMDFTGTVRGRATQGLATLECDPEVEVGLPYAEATVVGGNTVFADVNGNFTIVHPGFDPETLRSRLRGQWFEVFDQQQGGSTPEILLNNVTPPGPANFLHNPSDTEFETANVNAYLESNVIRDWVLFYQPTYPVIGTQTFFDINTNIDSNCNAFYNGSSINFYINGGGCHNTSFADVIYHEYGHHLINVTSNGQGQMGEGSGDTVGVLLQDEPILGAGFTGNCTSGIRTADNTLQYPCDGGIHFCGQVLSGAVWDTRNELAVTEPANYRDIGAELFLGMLMARGQMTPGDTIISPFITVLYLELDDDDTDIGNGTPHYAEIATGFGKHNLDAPPLAYLTISYPQGIPDLVSHNGGVEFTVEVTADGELPQSGTGVLHVDTGSGFEAYPMTEVSPNIYQANFPASDCATIIDWYVSAESTLGSTQYDPPDAASTFYSVLTGTSVVTVYSDDGETDPGWSVSGDATDGQWDRGTPVGLGDRGDPANDGDGSGQCWLTDNEDGNSDVDGGTTTITSPLMNATEGPGQIAVIQYWRWYSNNFGNDPNNDIFVVEISNDGGSTWSNLETVGPSGVEAGGGWYRESFRIMDLLPATNQMVLRFSCSDLGDGSVVEAAVDGIDIKLVTCETPVPAEGSKLLDGVVGGGVLADTSASDDVYFELDPNPTSNPIKQKVDLLVQSTSPIASPSSLRFRLESKMLGGPSGDVIQEIRVLNYATNTWETLAIMATAETDTVLDIPCAGTPSDYVQAVTNEVTARVIFSSESFSGTPFSWTVDVDESVWLID